MSRLTWWDQDGNEYEVVQRQAGPASPASIERADRLVDIHDAQGHLLAVLARSAPTEPAVIYRHGSALSPSFVLTDEGAAPAVVLFESDGMRLGTLDGAREAFELKCATCATEFTGSASELRDAMAGKTRRSKTPRVVLR